MRSVIWRILAGRKRHQRVRPTTVQLNAIARARTAASRAMARWTAMKTTDLPALNAKLKAAGLPAVTH